MSTSNHSKFKLIIGLGNPDKKYQNTYHSVGHLFIDYLKEGLKTSVYMNESGAFVKKALKKYSAKPKELLVVHDDSDIELGNYKLSFGRGAAGHHGVENIQATLKTKNFWRLRIGVRPNKVERLKAGDFVLKKITAADKKTLEAVFEKTGYNLKEIIKETL